MNRRMPSIRGVRQMAGSLAVLFFASCGLNSGPKPNSHLPEPAAAAQAVENALHAWQVSPDIARTTTTIRPIMFVDQQQPPGQRLLKFTVLGESPGQEGYRRFPVRLNFEQPDESIVVSYYVFGQGPIWVYRAEDFDMIMHMDKSMMAASPRAVAAPDESSHTKLLHRPIAQPKSGLGNKLDQ